MNWKDKRILARLPRETRKDIELIHKGLDKEGRALHLRMIANVTGNKAHCDTELLEAYKRELGKT